MQGNMAREFTRLWSSLTHVQPGLHGFVSHLHDVGLSALAAAIIMLGVVILLELRSMARLRHVTDRSLARVFEQLDLLRFETQALLEERRESREAGSARNAAAAHAALAAARPQAAPVSVSGRGAASPAAAVQVTPVSQVASPVTQAPPRAVTTPAARDLAAQRNLSTGEARLLSSLAEARARRLAAG